MLFHQGATRLREGGTGTAEGRELLREIAAGQLSPAGQQQIGLYLRMLEVTEAELDALRGQLTGAARRLAGAKALREQLYGVGPVTALALTCWLAERAPSSSDGAPSRPAPAVSLSDRPVPPRRTLAGGLQRMSGRIPRRRGTPNPSSCDRALSLSPRAEVRLAARRPAAPAA